MWQRSIEHVSPYLKCQHICRAAVQVNVTLKQATKAQNEFRSIALLFP